MTKRRANRAAPWSREKASRRVLTRVESWADSYCTTLVAACHPKQRDAVLDESILVSVLCPGRAGKTTAAEVRLLLTLLKKTGARCLFIAETKEHAANISWKKFQEVLNKLGIEHVAREVRREITIVKNGSTLQLVGADDKREIGKLRGMAWDGVVIDEAANYPPKLLTNLIHEVLEPRLGERAGWIMLIGTPGTQRSGPFYDATRPKGPIHRPYAERDHPKWEGIERAWSSHHWSLKDAADAGVAASRRSWEAALKLKKRNGWLDDNPVWMREYEGKWAADDTGMMFNYRPHVDEAIAKRTGREVGTAFNQWDPQLVGPMRLAELPADVAGDALTVLIFDKGFTDNFAVNLFSFSPSDVRRRIFHRYCFEAPGMFVRRFAVLLFGSRDDDPELPREPDDPMGLIGAAGWPVAQVGDVDQGFIEDLALYGLRAAKADKNLQSKATTIEEIKGDFAEDRIYVLKDSDLEEQLGLLQWVPDEYGANKEDKTQANHSSDCLIYARRVISPLFDNVPPPPPDPDAEPKTKPKKSRPSSRPAAAPSSGPHEDWSGLLASGTYEEPAW